MTTNYINEGYVIKKDNHSEEVIQIPYNITNTFITEGDILKILSVNNVKIKKINHLHYFQKAFTHKSYCNKNIIPEDILKKSKIELGNPKKLMELQNTSYERLEYLGDRVVKILVSQYLMDRYYNEDEGFMTRLQTKIEDKKNLAIMSKEIGLNKHFIISKQIEMLNGRNLEKINEDVFEAFMGALFSSNGFEPCKLLMLNLLESNIIDYSDKLYKDNNYKDSLLRHHHKMKWKFPKYIMIHHEGPPHKRRYIMGVENPQNNDDKEYPLKEKCISYGIGQSKKEGEQNAAKMSLIIFGLLQKDQYVSTDIYYPPWDKINNYDGQNGFLFENEDKNYKELDVKSNSNYYKKNVDEKSNKISIKSDDELSDITDSDDENIII
jgi:ribonuclease III